MSSSRVRLMERAVLGGAVGMLAAAAVTALGLLYVGFAGNLVDVFVRVVIAAQLGMVVALVGVPLGVAVALRRTGGRWVLAGTGALVSLLVATAAVVTALPEPFLLPALLVFGIGAPLWGGALAQRPTRPALVAA